MAISETMISYPLQGPSSRNWIMAGFSKNNMRWLGVKITYLPENGWIRLSPVVTKAIISFLEKDKPFHTMLKNQKAVLYGKFPRMQYYDVSDVE